MATSIQNLNAHELSLIGGGVTEGPDGKGCTQGPGGLGGLPDLGPSGPTIEIDASI